MISLMDRLKSQLPSIAPIASKVSKIMEDKKKRESASYMSPEVKTAKKIMTGQRGSFSGKRAAKSRGSLMGRSR